MDRRSGQTYCDCWAARVFDNLNQPISFVLQLIHLALVREQPVILEFLHVHVNMKHKKDELNQPASVFHLTQHTLSEKNDKRL